MASETVVLITGATGNLGRAVASHFERRGARLVLAGSRAQSLDEAFPDMSDLHLKLAADLTDPASAAGLVAAAEAKFGRIDAVCALAGSFRMGEPVHHTSPETWSSMYALNVATFVNVAASVVPGMIARQSGKIVAVGAVSALKGSANMGAYVAAKGSLMRLVESMSAELRPQGINVNCVLPSIIDTPENRAAMARADPSKWVKPDDLAEVIAFLCSDAARAMHGAMVPVVGLS